MAARAGQTTNGVDVGWWKTDGLVESDDEDEEKQAG